MNFPQTPKFFTLKTQGNPKIFKYYDIEFKDSGIFISIYVTGMLEIQKNLRPSKEG